MRDSRLGRGGETKSHWEEQLEGQQEEPQEQNVVEQVTLSDSEPVSTSSALTQKIRMCQQARTDKHR